MSDDKVPSGVNPAMPFGVVLRVLGAVLGGYAFTAAVVALIAVALPRFLGMARGEAVQLAAMLGFAIYLAVLLWAFVERRLGRLWLLLASGTALCAGLVQIVSPWWGV